MKLRKVITILAVGTMLLSFSACGKQAATDGEDTTVAEESTDAAAEDSGKEELDGMANSWSDISEDEADALVPNLFAAPEGATNVAWSKMEGDGNPMVQMTFDSDGLSYVARAQVTGDKEEDISGLSYEWDVEDEGTLSGWGDGNMPVKSYRSIGDDEWVDLCRWYDVEVGISYSLSVSSSDLDGFDLQAIAEQMYAPDKQESAKIPD